MSHTIRRRRSHTPHARGIGHGGRAAMERSHKYRKRDQVRAEAKAAPAPAVQVTDHALVRWLERVTGVDVRARIESEMLADGRAALVHQVGNGRIRINGSRTLLVVKNHAVVSVIVEEGKGA